MANISNLTTENIVGDATMPNGDFLTLDQLVVNKFSLVIPKMENTTFFLQEFSLPSVNVNEVNVRTRYVDINEVGEKMNYVPFTVTFMVDKYGRNWSECYNWMKEITVNGSSVGRTEDVILMINGQEFIRFIGAWPTTLTGLNMASNISNVQYVTASLTLNYDYFDLINTFATVDSSFA